VKHSETEREIVRKWNSYFVWTDTQLSDNDDGQPPPAPPPYMLLDAQPHEKQLRVLVQT
jgi:hypothetical protein